MVVFTILSILYKRLSVHEKEDKKPVNVAWPWLVTNALALLGTGVDTQGNKQDKESGSQNGDLGQYSAAIEFGKCFSEL